MKLNVKSVLQKEAERKAKPVPLPVVKLKGKVSAPKEILLPEFTEAKAAPVVNAMGSSKDDELQSLWAQMTAIKKDRAKLSTATARLVAEVYAGILKDEGQTVAREFMKGNIASPQLKDHYHKIQSLTDQAGALWMKIKHVEQYGSLEAPAGNKPQPVTESQQASALKYEIRRLDDLICKKKKNIAKAAGGLKKPKNSDRVNTWKEVVSMSEARRDDLQYQLKNLRA
jgi:hypothetical protein